MSETSENGTSDGVSMTKKTSAAAGRRPIVADLPLPGTMKAAFAALVLVIVGNVVRAIAVGAASGSSFRTYLIHTNNHAKKPKKPYTDAQISKDIHSLQSSYVIYAIISALVVIFLIWGLRKAKSASGSRWVLIFALFFTGSLGGIIPPYGFPGLIQATGIVIAAAALASIALVFAPPSTVYARASKEASLPEELRGQPRPKLFGPRPTPASRQAGGRPGGRPAARPAAPQANSAGGGKAKAKARNDAEAVARGAELARSRARASKSRRTDV